MIGIDWLVLTGDIWGSFFPSLHCAFNLGICFTWLYCFRFYTS